MSTDGGGKIKRDPPCHSYLVQHGIDPGDHPVVHVLLHVHQDIHRCNTAHNAAHRNAGVVLCGQHHALDFPALRCGGLALFVVHLLDIVHGVEVRKALNPLCGFPPLLFGGAPGILGFLCVLGAVAGGGLRRGLDPDVDALAVRQVNLQAVAQVADPGVHTACLAVINGIARPFATLDAILIVSGENLSYLCPGVPNTCNCHF